MKNQIEEILNQELTEEDLKEIERTSEQSYEYYDATHNLDDYSETSRGIIDEYKKSLDEQKSQNELLKRKLAEVRKEKNQKNDTNNIGVLNRAINDFDEKEIKVDNKFPGHQHPIFNYFFELANQYPNRKFLISSIAKKVREKQSEIDTQISKINKDIESLKECELEKELDPKGWEETVGSRALYLYTTTNIDTLNDRITQLEIVKENVNQWNQLKNGIKKKTIETEKEIKDNLYYSIMGEFDKLFEFCTNVGGITQYSARIPVKSFIAVDVHSALTEELEKQIGLCEEPFTHNFFYSNGEGRLIPFEIDRNILYYIHQNTTFIKYEKKGTQSRKGKIINSDDLFKKVPKYVDRVQHRNTNLVGFNNRFYNIKENKTEKLNPYAPILPLKNCKTEIYLDNEVEIEDNPMKHIFNECFKESDRKALLAYIGSCLYDKGYTQRQESIFLLSRGETGKTTLVKAICEIFYHSESQLIGQLNERFGLSVFADNDCVIIDEIQQAKSEFAQRLKELSTGANMPIEKKNVDTINLPAENVPRCWFIGNQFPKSLYYQSTNPAVYRRILCIVPTKPIQDLGYNYDELIDNSCLQWLVQQATKEYQAQGLHLSGKKPIEGIDNNEKLARMEMCTFPEKHFIKKHFEGVYKDNNMLDTDEFVYYEDMHNFIHKTVLDNMLEPTIRQGVSQTFIKHLREALELGDNYHASQYRGVVKFKGIKAKTEEAIEYMEEARKKREGDGDES